MEIYDYFTTTQETTSIYEDYYVHPNDVDIKFPERKRNLILIYLESMETTYASKDVGGAQEDFNYIPNLTVMATENISFSNKKEGELGGWRPLDNTGWTMASLYASASGLPYAFPLNVQEMIGDFSNTQTLGDILSENGYTNEFMCGSDISFAGRDKFFINNGYDIIFDYNTAIERNYISSDYKEWWGFEDRKLYEYAKDEITKLADDSPFCFTMLTVDTHMPEGYVCEDCELIYNDKTANVLHCADKQISDFIHWCEEQKFYDNTSIVIIGDHPRHDTPLVENLGYSERTVYNCFINSACKNDKGIYYDREFTELDIFPTILSSLGCSIEGNKLGMGVDLFSGEETLLERLGYNYLNAETQKTSKFYLENFY